MCVCVYVNPILPIYPAPLYPLVTMSLFSMFVTLLLFWKFIYTFFLKKYSIYVISYAYNICLSVSDLLHSVWQSLCCCKWHYFVPFLWLSNIPPLMIFSRLLCWLPLLPAPKWSPSEVQPLALSIPFTLFLGDLTQAMTLISCPWVWLPNLLMVSAFRVSGWNSGHHELFLSSRTTFLTPGVSSKPNPPTCSFPPAGSLIPYPPCDTVCSYSGTGSTSGALFRLHVHPGHSQFWKMPFLPPLSPALCQSEDCWGLLACFGSSAYRPLWAPCLLSSSLLYLLSGQTSSGSGFLYPQWLPSAFESVLSSSASPWGPCTWRPSLSYFLPVHNSLKPGRMVYFLFSKHT